MITFADSLQRFELVCERLKKALVQTGRSPNSIRLMAVSKFHSPEHVAAIANYWNTLNQEAKEILPDNSNKNCPLFGESYVQEALAKQQAVKDILDQDPYVQSINAKTTNTISIDWHFIGHIQSNKAKDLAGRFSLIHSVDSLRVGTAIQKGWEAWIKDNSHTLHKAIPAAQGILIQVNIGEEEQKSGVLPKYSEKLVRSLAAMPGLDIQGLMCIPPEKDDPQEVRPYFQAMRFLRDNIQHNTGLNLPHLSMGMSHDFEIAIEEGSTIVRIGTDIFGART